MNTAILDNIQIDPKARASINYAKARCAIEANLKCRKDKRAAKMVLVEHLGGTIIHPEQKSGLKPLPNYVLFADKTQARF